MSVYLEKSKILEWWKMLKTFIDTAGTNDWSLLHKVMYELEEILNH